MCIVPLDAAVGAAVVMAVAGLPPYGVGCSCATVEVVSRQLPRCGRYSATMQPPLLADSRRRSYAGRAGDSGLVTERGSGRRKGSEPRANGVPHWELGEETVAHGV